MLHTYFQDILVILGFATLVVTLFNSLKLPPLVGFLGAGVLIGPHGLGIISNLPGTQIISELGVIFLLFTIGLEFSFQKLSQHKKTLLSLGALQVLLTTGVVFAIGHWVLERSAEQSLLWGFLISLSSTAIVLKLLSEKRELETVHGGSAINILLSQDILVLPMLLILPTLAGQSDVSQLFHTNVIIMTVLKLVVVIAATILLAKKIIPFLFEKIARTNSRELFFFFLIFFCFGMSYVFEIAKLSASLGAFVAGLMIAESPYGKQATSDFVPLRDNFLGMFFISIGMLLNISFITQNLFEFLILGASVFILKTTILYLCLRFNHLTHKVSLLTSLLVFQVGEFSFVIANEAFKLNLMTNDELQYFIGISVISLAATPFFFNFAPQFSQSKKIKKIFPKEFPSFLRKSDFETKVDKKTIENHAIVIGYGLAGESLAENFQNLKIPFIAIEYNPQSFQTHIQNKKENIIFGDASSTEILEKAHLETAQLVIITASGTIEQVQSILRSIRKERKEIPIILRLQYLRNASEVTKDPNLHIVVAEFETSIEVLTKALKAYEIPEEEVHLLIHQTRMQYKDRLGDTC